MCTRLLASIGAEVIKIEPPRKGDPVRNFGFKIAGDSYLFHINNYNKKSVSLDTNTPEGKEIFLQLVEKVDILVENFKPGTMNKYGLGYDVLKQVNPALIYCSANGFGWTGPMGMKGAFDTVIQARSGILSVTGSKGGPPTKVGPSAADVSGAIGSAVAVLAALYHRRRKQQGQFIDLAMFDVISWMTAEIWPFILAGVDVPGRIGNRSYFYAPHNHYQARDRLVVIAVTNEKQWKSLLDLMGRNDLKEDERYDSSEKRVDHADEIDVMVGSWAIQYQAGEVVEKCQAAGIPAGVVLELSDIADHPHAADREMLVNIDNPLVGSMKMIGCPLKLSKTPGTIKWPTVRLGEHNREVLCGLLGYSEERIGELEEKGII
jgi:crotonobetainyl-CoA:carnitine CoA-transferase CaiB-like acyl-CoA transferase